MMSCWGFFLFSGGTAAYWKLAVFGICKVLDLSSSELLVVSVPLL